MEYSGDSHKANAANTDESDQHRHHGIAHTTEGTGKRRKMESLDGMGRNRL